MKKTLKERFDEKWIEDKKTGCWEWQAYKDGYGYGVLNVNQKPIRAHTVSWMLHKDEPLPQVVRHRCDNPSCCNPECLEGGTKKQNSEDMVQRGRSCQGERHCFSVLTEKQAKAIKLLQELKAFLIEQGLTDKCFPGLGKVTVKGLFRTHYQEVYCNFTGTTEELNIAIAKVTSKYKKFKRTEPETTEK